ncbi:FAD-dependent oxidoreductase [Pontiellaceae bacterium B12227]|nr:FAD-dependent oxidoreductase [Pontiellaceae bacterium B12227]
MNAFANLRWGLAVALLSVLTAPAAKQNAGAYWRMNDGVGTEVVDSSGNGNTLTLKNSAWSQGLNSPAVTMKTDGLISAAHSRSLAPAKAITLEAWSKYWDPNFKDSATMIDKEGSYRLSYLPGKRVGVTLWIDGKAHTLASKNTQWDKGRWIYVAATFDGKKMVLYVNGEKDNELPVSGRIDVKKTPVFVGSQNGKHVLWNGLDDIRISGSALSADKINETHLAGRFDAARQDARHAAFFHKGEKREAKEVVPAYIWIDAEDFDDYGGWWMETQFVPQMGSPYMMAAGTGEPVDDAKTTIQIERDGSYKLWVRNRNWIKEHNPGTFNVLVNGNKSETVFGTEQIEEWVWQDGGTFDLKAGDVELTLHDLTGYYGRCDALILTRDMHYVPPFSFEGYKGEQRRLTGRGADEVTVGDYDVVVVGAGAAGINAAIASARAGAKTVLIQNRPMIGGNNSPEMGVPILGPADCGKKNAREGGLNEEIGRLRAYNFMLKWSQGAEVVAANEKNLTIVLNTHVYDVERTNGNRITAVRAFDTIDGRLTKYTGRQFIDCTGDAWLGYYAGAELMRGREPKWVFNESNAPDDGDILTMSGSLFHAHTLGYNSTDIGKPSPFDAPTWAWDLSENTEVLEARKRVENTYKSGTWWHENRNEVDDLWNPEAARDGLIRVSISYWNWAKNVSPMFKEKSANRKLLPLPLTNAKRETCRLVGDVIVTQDDVLKARPWKDRVGYGGWGLDIHHPEAIFSKEGPFDFNTHAPLHSLPFRMLYSKNVPNLMMAGRNVSCSHVALGTMRVQATTAQMGQAVGTAAAMCVEKDTDPRGIYQNHIYALQQQLIKNDMWLLEMRNEDPNDLALMASVSASSEKSALFSAQHVINGVTRVIDDEMNMWASDPEQALPQWLELDFGSKKKVNSVYLTIDTDVNDAKRATWEWKDSERMPPEAVRDYQVQVLKGKKWITVADVKDNYQRRRIHRFQTLETSHVRILITASNGDPSARIYEVRAYNE